MTPIPRERFHQLLRDLLANIYDYAILEKHPLNEWVARPTTQMSRAEALRRFVWKGIEAMRPSEARSDSLEWRYYQILAGRYIDGVGMGELLKRLALGERQERRLHGRALEALEDLLWDHLFPAGKQEGQALAQEVPAPNGTVSTVEDGTYPINLEALALNRVVQEVMALCAPRIQAYSGNLLLQVPEALPDIRTDRVVLRQILLEMINRLLAVWSGGDILVGAQAQSGQVILEIEAAITPSAGHEALPQGQVHYWIERLNASLMIELDEEAGERESGLPVRFVLQLPQANQVTILVVDDHEPAIRIVQRYLSQTNLQAVGATDPIHVLQQIHTIRPQAILLDVMMPGVDGWEILQALKSDPETQRTPVIVCSVWDQPDLAFSLGATGFLKKPINQGDLLVELKRLNLLDTSGE